MKQPINNGYGKMAYFLRRQLVFYLKAWNTQEGIADILGVTHPTISNIVENIKKRQMSIFCKTFQPILYKIWQKLKQDNDADHLKSDSLDSKVL